MTPRTLEFKITLSTLIWKHWIDWHEYKEEDFKNVLAIARKNHLQFDTEGEMIFQGSQTDLFFFLHDLSFRYDIEIL